MIAESLDVASASGPMKVLDIAAGHGAFGIAIAQRNPNAQIVAVDWPNVLQVARENAAAAGLQDRHHSLPGDAFRVDYGQRLPHRAADELSSITSTSRRM